MDDLVLGFFRVALPFLDVAGALLDFLTGLVAGIFLVAFWRVS